MRYNPEGDAAMNQRAGGPAQAPVRLPAPKSKSLFMFELLVPATTAQLDRLGGTRKPTIANCGPS